MNNLDKKYKVGFFGGKFIPFHLGHLYCVEKMSEQCEKGYVILFGGGDQEIEILSKNHDDSLRLDNRWSNVCKVALQYFDNIIPIYIDVSNCKLPDGTEDWDAETPLVLDRIGKMDVVYSSEPSYDAYFKKAYPWAKHVLVDPPRIIYPISATMIRNMKTEEEKSKWRI